MATCAAIDTLNKHRVAVPHRRHRHVPYNLSFRRHQSKLCDALHTAPDVALQSLAVGLYSDSIIDGRTKAEVLRHPGYKGADMLMDSVDLHVQRDPQIGDTVLNIMSDQQCLQDIVEEIRANDSNLLNDESNSDNMENSSVSSSDSISRSSKTQQEVVEDAEALNSKFEILLDKLLAFLEPVTVDRIQLQLSLLLNKKVVLTKEIDEILDKVDEKTNRGGIIAYLVRHKLLGYLNHRLLDAFTNIIDNEQWNTLLEDYKDSRNDFLKSTDLKTLAQVFDNHPSLAPQVPQGIPTFTVHLNSSWDNSTYYRWNELLEKQVNWPPFIYIKEITNNCIIIEYGVLPFFAPAVVRDLTDPQIVSLLEEQGVTKIDLSDELMEYEECDSQSNENLQSIDSLPQSIDSQSINSQSIDSHQQSLPLDDSDLLQGDSLSDEKQIIISSNENQSITEDQSTDTQQQSDEEELDIEDIEEKVNTFCIHSETTAGSITAKSQFSTHKVPAEFTADYHPVTGVVSEDDVASYTSSCDSGHDSIGLMKVMVKKVQQSSLSPGLTVAKAFTPKSLKDIILKQSVPVSLAAVCILGLPHSRKSKFLGDMLTNGIHLGSGYDKDITEKIVLQRMLNDTALDNGGLSVYLLCVLGGLMQGKTGWALPHPQTSPHHDSMMPALVSSMTRQLNLQGFSYDIQFKYHDTVSTTDIRNEIDEVNKDILKHFSWAFEEVITTWNNLKKRRPQTIESLANGFSIITIFDVGVNRAVYDLLPYIANYCDNLVRLVFFDVERDAMKLSHPPKLDYKKYQESSQNREDMKHVMQWRSRLDYLMHFASIGYQPGLPETEVDTVFIGSRSKELDDADQPSRLFAKAKSAILEKSRELELGWIDDKKYWIELEQEQLKKRANLVEEIITNRFEYKYSIPVKWIFLRSFLSSSSCPQYTIVSMQYIQKLSAQSFEMDDKECKRFLDIFKKYGSLLHFHDFHNINQYVIVDTSRFAIWLSKLYYPSDSIKCNHRIYSLNLHKKYGLVILETGISKLIGVKSHSEFMKIIEELGLVAKINGDQIEGVPNKDEWMIQQKKKYYFIPSARIGALVKPDYQELTSLYIQIKSAQFPANIQSSISKAMINEAEMSLIVCETANVTQFKSTKTGLQVEFRYFGEVTEIRTLNPGHKDHFITVLNACCSVFTQRAQRIREFLSIKIGFKCLNNFDSIHNLPIYFDTQAQPAFCHNCFRYYEQTDAFKPWIAAAKQSDLLRIHNFENGIMKGTPLLLDDIVFVAKKLATTNNCESNVETLVKLLQINKDKFEELKEEQLIATTDDHMNQENSDSQLIVKLIFHWQQIESKAKRGVCKERLQFIVDNILKRSS